MPHASPGLTSRRVRRRRAMLQWTLVLAAGLLIWARLRLITNYPRTAIAGDDVPASVSTTPDKNDGARRPDPVDGPAAPGGLPRVNRP